MALNKKIVLVLGLCYFMASIYFAYYWAEERIAFGDAAYQLFSILRTNDFAIQVMRFGSAVTQIFPLIGSKLHLSLQSIVYLYSLSFECIALLVFLFVLLRFDNARLATVLLLTKTLITTHTFFWVQSELLQGIVLLLLFLAWLRNKYIERLSIVQYCFFFFFTFLLAFIHPLMVFPFLFCMLFMLTSAAAHYQSKSIKTSIALFLILSIIKVTILKNSYDSGAMSGLKNFVIHFPNYFNSPSNYQFFKYCFTDYYLLPVVFVVVLIAFIYNKNWGMFMLSLLFPLFFFLIVQIANYDGLECAFRIESFYIPLALMLSFALIEVFYFYIHAQRIIYLSAALSIVLFLWRIQTAYPAYHQQLCWNKQFVQTHLNDKLVITEAELSKNNMMLPWAFPYQSWIISTLYYHHTASFATVKNKNDLDWAFANNHLYLTSWGNFEYWQLPHQYFILNDNSSFYKNY